MKARARQLAFLPCGGCRGSDNGARGAPARVRLAGGRRSARPAARTRPAAAGGPGPSARASTTSRSGHVRMPLFLVSSNQPSIRRPGGMRKSRGASQSRNERLALRRSSRSRHLGRNRFAVRLSLLEHPPLSPPPGAGPLASGSAGARLRAGRRRRRPSRGRASCAASRKDGPHASRASGGGCGRSCSPPRRMPT